MLKQFFASSGQLLVPSLSEQMVCVISFSPPKKVVSNAQAINEAEGVNRSAANGSRSQNISAQPMDLALRNRSCYMCE